MTARETVTVTLRMPASLKKAIEEAARRDEKSQNEIMLEDLTAARKAEG